MINFPSIQVEFESQFKDQSEANGIGYQIFAQGRLQLLNGLI